MNIDELKEIVQSAVEKLKTDHFFILDRRNDVTELVVSTHLSSILASYFDSYNVDAEWNRMRNEHGGYVPKRLNVPDDKLVQPDIIVHKRGNNQDNLLVIEIKMTWKNQKKEFDFLKIEAYKSELNYNYGLYLELSEKGVEEQIWY